MAEYLEQICYGQHCCLLVRTNFIAANAVLFQERCAIIRQMTSGARRLCLCQGVDPIAIPSMYSFLRHCRDRAALDDKASSRQVIAGLALPRIAKDIMPRCAHRLTRHAQ